MANSYPVVENYEIIGLHQTGALTEVYRARDTRSGEIVALKMLKVENLGSGVEAPEKAELRFLREFRIFSELSHPNIVSALDFGFIQGYYYIAMEFVGGGDLCDLLEKRQRLSELQAWRVLEDIGSALECAQTYDLLHRDIKPGNILVTDTGVHKLTDFGLAVLRRDRGLLTESDLVLGTLEYASPEQLRGGDIDIRTDIYSLGVTLYELLSLKMPFVGKNPTDTMQKVCLGRKLPLRLLAPDVSNKLSTVIHKMTEAEPDKRYASPGHLLDDVRQLQEK